MSDQKNSAESLPAQPKTLEEALHLLAQAQETIDQLRHEREIANRFFHSICNYAVRTPLMAIQGFAKLIPNNAKDIEDCAELGYYILKNAHKIQHVINTTRYILFIERTRTGLDSLPNIEKVDLKQLIQDKDIVDLDYVEITPVAGNLSNVMVNPHILMQTIIDIAFILTDRGDQQGQATLSIEAKETWNIIKINHPERVLHDIETRMAAIMATPTFFAGYLGDDHILSIGRYFMESYGGRLEIDSGEGRGTTISLLLPKLPD